MPIKKYRTTREQKKAITRQNNEYKKRAQTAFTLRYHNVNDAPVIAKLKSENNKIDYVRKLIMKDIKKEG